MPTLSLTLPSGLAGEVRGLKGREVKLLGESKNPYFDVLDGCWVGTTAPGPYTLHDGVKPRWSEVLAGDIMTALLKVSEATFGTERVVNWACTDRNCRGTTAELNPTPINVARDIKIRPLAPALLAAFSAGNRVEITVAGVKVWHRLQTGATLDAAFRTAGTGGADLFHMLAGQIDEIEGVRQFDQDKVAWLEDLELADLRILGKMMQSHECGPEQSFETQCAFCKRSQSVPFPFIDFLLNPDE